MNILSLWGEAMIAVSACLLGENCKYNGGNNLINEIALLKGKVIAICPEVLGGLTIPRKPCEIKDGKIISKDKEDFSDLFYLEAKKALEICKENDVNLVILKENSPSCGCYHIYDGSFSNTLIKGRGVFAQMLIDNGIKCIDEGEYLNECI